MAARIINTGIPSTDNKSKEILSSVIGQLSDGIWENSPGMAKYWQNLDVDTKDNNIVIVEDIYSPFWKYSSTERDKKVLEFFANKIKQIIKTEIDDGNDNLEWDRNCTGVSDYLGYKEEITVRDAYKVYDKLKGRKDRIKESRKLTEANELKGLKVKVYVERLNYLDEVNERTLIAAFRNEKWSEDFVKMAESWCRADPGFRVAVERE